jgi:hypothetical protein
MLVDREASDQPPLLAVPIPKMNARSLDTEELVLD